MSEEVDPKLLKQVRLTQELLGEFVKRPSLTEKHLMRPPFRYLHDVFMAVTEATGFFRGLFTPEEQNPANFTTKEAKTSFIEKVVAVIELTSGQSLDIKTAKVLAGSEADKTNNLLQLLARCLKKRQSSDEAVKSVTTGVVPKEIKGGRRGSNSNEPVKTNTPKRTTTGAGASQDSKGKTKDKPEKGTAATTTSKTRTGAAAAGGDKDSKAAGKFNSYNPSKTPVGKAVVPPAGNKSKPSARRLSTENTGTKPMRATPSGKDAAATDIVEDKPGASSSRRGSLGSPAPKNRKDESDTQKSSAPISTPTHEMPEKAKVQDEIKKQPQPPPTAMASTSHEELMGEINFLSNQFGYDCDIEDCEESEAGHNNSVLMGSGDVERLNQNEPAALMITERRPSLEFSNATGDGESEDNDDEDDVDNIPSRSQFSGEPDPALVDTKSNVTAASAKQRPPSRNNLRKLAEAQKQEFDQAASKSDNENKPTQKSVVPEKALARPPTAGIGRPPASARPSSARPGAPRPRSAMKVIVDENAYRPPTGKVVNVLMDNEKLEEDDNYVVQEVAPPMKSLLDEFNDGLDLRSGGPLALGDVDSNVPESERGLLLNQILETQKTLEGSRLNEEGAGDAERFKHIRENTRAEVEKLQNLIQTTAKSAHPFGKLLDFIQEDVDSIHKELNKWQEESLKLDVVLEEEILKTEEALAPMRQELAQIREAIQNKKDAMESTRMDILNHQARLAKITNSIEHVKPPGQHNYTIKFPSVVKLFGFEAEFSPEERVMVFGEGGKVDQSSDPPPLRTRPTSQYRTPSHQTSMENTEKPEPYPRKDSLGQNGPDMRTRMKNLASSLAKDMGQDDDEDELEGFDPGLDGFRGSVASSRSSMSPNYSEANSVRLNE